MEISPLGLAEIKASEGYRSHAYPDPGTNGEPYTIGYGTAGNYPDGRKVLLTDTCIESEAETWLRARVLEFEQCINLTIQTPINQPMFDALCSFVYNVGPTAFKRSTLARLLNAGEYIEAQQEFDRWAMAGGHVMQGLARRRDREQAMFNDGIRLVLKDQPQVLAMFNSLVDSA